MASQDLNELFNEALGFAEYMLLSHGEFIPFGVSMDLTGKISQVAGYLGTERPASAEMVDFLQRAFFASATKGEIRAAGVCIDMHVTPPGQTAKSDAICVRLAHISGETAAVYVPYAANTDGYYSYGDTFATKGTQFKFSEP